MLRTQDAGTHRVVSGPSFAREIASWVYSAHALQRILAEHPQRMREVLAQRPGEPSR